MRLILLHPEVAYRSCEDCQKYVYDEVKGERQLYRDQPVEREPGSLPKCRMGLCPKGTPEKSLGLSEKNWRAYHHYLQCRAAGKFPDDPIVLENAAVIRSVYDSHEAFQREVVVSRMLILTKPR